MPPLLHILCGHPPDAPDRAVSKFAEFLGLSTELVPVRGDMEEPPAALRVPAPGGRVLALASRTLRELIRRDWIGALFEEARFVFVYGFGAAGGEWPELAWLTRGALSSVASLGPGPKRFTVHEHAAFKGFPVYGRSYSEATGSLPVFSTAAGPGVDAGVSADGHPVLVMARRGRAAVFLLTDVDWVDLDRPLAPDSTLRPWYPQLLAASVFLRSAFGSACWTSPVTGATVVIDDPYLKARYGFIRYETLMRELTRTGSALTVAFIPYNYRRSDPATVSLLRRHAARFSICVHGCDHTGGEFAGLDAPWLAGTAGCALERMEAHARRTQMPFDRVMVFPQGRFSRAALSALGACGFHAAVNSTAWPGDAQEAPLTARDLLDVAVTRYPSVPLFVRRYPRDVFDFAFDALFQKPLLAVEHHGFFRHGYGRFADFVGELSTLSPKVAWMPLGQTVMSSCVLKQTGEGQCALRHFASVLRFANPSTADLSLSLEKPEADGDVEAVRVGDQKVPFEIRSGVLKYAACLRAGETLNVSVLYPPRPRTRRSPSWQYRLAAAGRRALCDARDNYLARSERVLAICEKAKTAFLRVSGAGS